ncbi:MAG: hypothetical protein QW451_02835 [Candidatus Aenigmatarchaeota archaeon]
MEIEERIRREVAKKESFTVVVKDMWDNSPYWWKTYYHFQFKGRWKKLEIYKTYASNYHKATCRIFGDTRECAYCDWLEGIVKKRCTAKPQNITLEKAIEEILKEKEKKFVKIYFVEE